MSWSYTSPVMERDTAFDLISALVPDQTLKGPMRAQFETAKLAAIQIAAVIPGPFIRVVMSGHANGIGWQEQDGWANDYLSVQVVQHTKQIG